MPLAASETLRGALLQRGRDGASIDSAGHVGRRQQDRWCGVGSSGGSGQQGNEEGPAHVEAPSYGAPIGSAASIVGRSPASDVTHRGVVRGSEHEADSRLGDAL